MGNRLDLLLINPGATKKRAYQDLSEDFSAIEPPFWVALTAGFIRDKGYNVAIIDANAKNLTNKETARKIVEANSKLINIVVYGQHPSASTQLMGGVGDLCREIKLLETDRKIILTGLHPSALPERTLKEEQVDYVCQGEGFSTLNDLLSGKELNCIGGLWYWEGSEIQNNPRAKNIENLTLELGEVAWDLIPFKDGNYRAHNWQCLDGFDQRPNYASISTSLGCPFKCDFCSIHTTFGERKVRYWDPEWVADQIEFLHDMKGVNVFKFIDEMFVLNPKHYEGIADELISRGLGEEVNIWSYARVDTISEKHLDKMQKAGFKWLCFGFESGNEEILKQMHKGSFSRDDMLNVSEMVKDHGINIIANYMFGFPEDTETTMNETLDLAIKQNCEFANFYCAAAWPGSELYNQVLNQGVELPEKWADYAQHAYGFIPLPTNHLSARDVLKFRDEAFDTYFTNPEYLKTIESKFGLPAKEHIQEMAKTKLKRKLLGS